jgi:archaeal flagellar protein FlaJ
MAKKVKRFLLKNKVKIIGIIVALISSAGSFIFFGLTDLFYFILGISFVVAGLPFFIELIIESRFTKEKDEMFLEFSRNLVESVKAGTPISKSILNVREKDYGVLNPHINKLANQISIGIPLKTSLETFARDINSRTISRSVNIISESEKAGGQIENILDSVVNSVAQTEKLKKERSAAMYTLIVQGYIIFFIFLVIMLVMQFKVLPIASTLGEGMEGVDSSSLSGTGSLGGVIGGGTRATPEQLSRPFIWLLLTQGFFAGLVIGKISEGSIKSGLKHSFILLIIALLVQTGANVFLG